jgi:peptidoglycan hydrolase CwlO-like protein
MSKVKKMEVTPKAITKDELKKVTDLQTELQSYLANIGVLEVQKAKAIYQVNMLEKDMDQVKKDIEATYGAININLTDGTYEEIKE